MESRSSGFLCLDQGLGKTACAIVYINRQRNTRNIIIVPPVAIYVWLSEFQKWAPGEDVTAVTTTAQLKKVIDGFTGNLILSYDVFQSEPSSGNTVWRMGLCHLRRVALPEGALSPADESRLVFTRSRIVLLFPDRNASAKSTHRIMGATSDAEYN